MQRIRIKFSKGPEVKFISHLDMIRCFERSMRRADIPVGYSSGFNPRPSVAWGPPLVLGIESSSEFADIDIEGWAKPAKIMDDLNSSLPKGFRILEATIGDPKGKSLDSVINRAEYLIDVEVLDAQKIKDSIDSILKMKSIVVVKNEKATDKRPLLHGLKFLEAESKVALMSEIGKRGTLKPKEISDLIEGIRVKGVKRVSLFVA